MKYSFTGLSESQTYTVYPIVNWLGFDILAKPAAELKMEFPVSITDFRQTSSTYNEGGYANNGKTYSYKFDCAVTVELKDNEGVSDWGYAYLDPDGNETLISLKEFGFSYTDNRYVYYRNEAKSTCTLYGYVKYEGTDNPVYDEPHEFPLEYNTLTCPDNNHPHMVDLGLPSGTKWACCNVGASKPEDYGGYYAWGETSEKNRYVPSNYSFSKVGGNNPLWYTIDGVDHRICEENGVCYSFIDIGESISGTKYDAAYVNWGTAWQMPTWNAIWEMVCSCSSEWIELNGVYGRLYTGQNGNQIFMPFGGYKDDVPNPFINYTSLFNSEGCYWSGTLDDDIFYAKSISMDSRLHRNSGAQLRYRGQAIRPVAR